MSPIPLTGRALFLAPLLVLAACGDSPESSDDRDDDAREAVDEARTEAGASIDGVGLSADIPGTAIDEATTEDGDIALGITDAVLYSRLSPALQREIADEMDAEVGDEEGFGADLARTITGAIAEGLRTAISVPLSDVRDVRAEGGRLVIEMADGEPSPFESAKTNGRPLLESFDADAAQRLAEAFDKAASR
ncbi:hypothetical protein [Rubrivirga sp. IMCC43871]|uniref:hypothetical protein n=1 Tax=Rubrivirga sp. IMCC43871 TaxID=3391575 RepID=UPI0039900679